MYSQIENSMVSSSYSSIQPDEIVGYLKKNLQFKEVCQAILTQKIIDQAAQERKIVVSPEEIQAEADRVRRDHRLERAADTLAWLEDQQIIAEDWEAGIRDRLITQKLKEALFGRQVETFFAENRLNFERVILYQIVVPYEHVAREVFYQTEEREISFYEAAHLYDIDSQRRYQCGYEGAVYRWSLKPEIAAAAFGATPGEIVRPVQTEQGFHLLLIEEFISAQLTPEVYQEILTTLFREWLTGELNHWLHQ